MVLVLLKGIRRRGGSGFPLVTPGVWELFLRPMANKMVKFCVCSICMLLVFVFWGVDAVLGDGCGIWERLLSFSGVKWAHRSVQDFIFWFCVWCKSGELGGRGIPRFPCLTTVMESFYSDFLWAIISYWTKSHLESSQTSMM